MDLTPEELRRTRIEKKEEHIGALHTHRIYLESKLEVVDAYNIWRIKFLLFKVNKLIEDEIYLLTKL